MLWIQINDNRNPNIHSLDWFISYRGILLLKIFHQIVMFSKYNYV